MAGDCGLNALSLLPENMLPQWLQKIALRAENPSGHTAYNDMVEANFLRSNFLQVLDLHIFLQKQPGHWGRGCLHFHLLLYPIFCLPNGNGYFGIKICAFRDVGVR